jgi:hypothetical protein
VYQRGGLHDGRIGPIGPGEPGRLCAHEVHVVPAVERQVRGEPRTEPPDPAFYLVQRGLFDGAEIDSGVLAEHRASSDTK